MKLLVKSLTYRVLSLAITASVGFALTGSLVAGLAVGLGDSAIKIFAYAAFEKAWETGVEKAWETGVESLTSN